MTKLFIIGNGFDIAHGLPTTYNDFREYLLKEYPNVILGDGLFIPDSERLPKGGVIYDDTELVSLLITIIDAANQTDRHEIFDGIEYHTHNWSDLENSLAYLDYREFFDGYDDAVFDKDGTKNLLKTASRNEDLTAELVFLTEIKKYFQEWILSIKLNNIQGLKDFNKIIEENDLFLNFNYTRTLEEKYNIEQSMICHIHCPIPASNPQHETVFFGHGDNTAIENNISGSEHNLNIIKKELRKDTTLAFEYNEDFFIELQINDVTEIYSYGFSYNEIDMIYIENILLNINNNNMTWYFNDYDSPDSIIKWKNKLKSLGYTGSFDYFSVKK